MPVEAFPWGSRSSTRTRLPVSARAAPRLTAVVDLPTPPFWLAIAMILVPSGRREGSTVSGPIFGDIEPPSGVRGEPEGAAARGPDFVTAGS